MMKRKGQGAMEYLMTYGWAILVVMIVGVVLWQLGIFGPSSTVNTARGFSKVKPLEPSIKYSTAGGLTFTVVNGAGATVTGVNITSGSCTVANQNTVIAAGDTYQVSIAGCGVKAGGESFSVPVNITYVETVVGSAVQRLESGTIRGTCEKV